MEKIINVTIVPGYVNPAKNNHTLACYTTIQTNDNIKKDMDCPSISIIEQIVDEVTNEVVDEKVIETYSKNHFDMFLSKYGDKGAQFISAANY